MNEHRYIIQELARAFRPRVYVEIGAHYGDTFNLVSMHAERSIAVDPAPRYIKTRSGVEVFRGTSRAFAHGWAEPIDMLFIDGDHAKDAVMADFNKIGRHVREDTGLILIHDTHPVRPELTSPEACHDSWRLPRIIKVDYSLEFVTLPGPTCGLTIVRKTTGGGKPTWMN
jgi:predicted O-methyltransferase YrrM